MSAPIVIVGAGLAAAKAVEALRQGGYDGGLVVFGEEPHRPYERPPLSKEYLTGSAELAGVFVHDADWYTRHDVDLRPGTRVTGLDLSGRQVTAGTGSQPYDRLLIATGASPRHLPMADESGAPVAYLRTIEDSNRIKSELRPGLRLVVVGGGWIGLEVAAAARAADAQVTVVESAELPLLAVLGPEVADIFASLHRDYDVDLRVSTTVTAVQEWDGRAVVHLSDASTVDADLVVVGIGVVPNVSLAEDAGLRTGDGILVDEYLRTSDPHVYAAGDVAAVERPGLARPLRVEHWDNAINQGIVAGRNLAGDKVAYDRAPYFFTDQYDLGMEYVGHVAPGDYDRVIIRGVTTGSRLFTAFWLGGHRVLAGMHANDWDAIDPIRALVGEDVDPDRLADAAVPLSELL